MTEIKYVVEESTSRLDDGDGPELEGQSWGNHPSQKGKKNFKNYYGLRPDNIEVLTLAF